MPVLCRTAQTYLIILRLSLYNMSDINWTKEITTFIYLQYDNNIINLLLYLFIRVSESIPGKLNTRFLREILPRIRCQSLAGTRHTHIYTWGIPSCPTSIFGKWEKAHADLGRTCRQKVTEAPEWSKELWDSNNTDYYIVDYITLGCYY